MTELPLRRVLAVALAYVVGGWVVLYFGAWLRRFLLLPPLFESLLRWGVIGGFFLALILAWSYPSLGTHGGTVHPHSDEDGPPS
ncbi:MAG: hypothetical protein AAF389_08850 [Gemmatimonadota bacterium]